MKKAFVLLLCALLFVATTATAAFAGGLSLPEMSTCIDGVTLDQKSDNPPLYVYVFDDDDALLNAMIGYMVVLDEYYGFSIDAMGVDEVSSDTFMYFYLPEYNGDASISPAYMDECPEPCYILFAVTGSAQGYLLVVMPAEGIDFNGKLPAAPVAATQPFATENGTRLMNPVEFSDGAVYCNELTHSSDPEDDADWYAFHSTAGDYSHLTVAENYLNAMLNSGYYELLVERVGENGIWYCFDYVGGSYLHECDDASLHSWSGETDIEIYVTANYLGFTVHPTLGFITEPVKQDRPSPRYDDDDDYDYDDDDDDRREKCSYCNGEGEVDCISCVDGRIDCGGCYDGTYRLSDGSRRDCSSCNGKGWRECSACRGEGEKDCSYCNDGWR